MQKSANGDVLPGDDVLHTAAEWVLKLSEKKVNHDVLMDFERWREADPLHARAVENMQRFVGKMNAIKNEPVESATLQAVLLNQPAKKKNIRGGYALLLAMLLTLPIWSLMKHSPIAYLMADVKTNTAEWKTHVLPDQSHITLTSATAIDIEFTGAQRTIKLIKGEILVEVAHDQQRPFIVETDHGSIRALGTRFVVDLHDHQTILTMLESRVLARSNTANATAGNAGAREVSAGQRVRMDDNGVSKIKMVDAESLSDAWNHHQLLVQDRSMSSVLDELARQRKGYLHYDNEALAALRVSAVLPLEDTDRALRMLASTFPISVNHMTPWLTIVTLRQDATKQISETPDRRE